MSQWASQQVAIQSIHLPLQPLSYHISTIKYVELKHKNIQLNFKHMFDYPANRQSLKGDAAGALTLAYRGLLCIRCSINESGGDRQE